MPDLSPFSPCDSPPSPHDCPCHLHDCPRQAKATAAAAGEQAGARAAAAAKAEARAEALERCVAAMAQRLEATSARVKVCWGGTSAFFVPRETPLLSSHEFSLGGQVLSSEVAEARAAADAAGGDLGARVETFTKLALSRLDFEQTIQKLVGQHNGCARAARPPPASLPIAAATTAASHLVDCPDGLRQAIQPSHALPARVGGCGCRCGVGVGRGVRSSAGT